MSERDVPRLALRELCGYRAGDKGDIANVALFADDDETFELIRRGATAERVKEHFGEMVTGRVDRYEAANVRALNFVMQGALGGGGPRSLRADSLGKPSAARSCGWRSKSPHRWRIAGAPAPTSPGPTRSLVNRHLPRFRAALDTIFSPFRSGAPYAAPS